MPRTAAHVRAELASVVELDLIGPTPGHALESEVLDTPPSRWYLTGFLVPFEAEERDRTDETANEELGVAGAAGTDDDATPDGASTRRAHLPSSMGASVLVPEGIDEIVVTVSWGDYRVVEAAPDEEDTAPASTRGRELWQRTPRSEDVPVGVKTGRKPYPVPSSDGLELVVSCRPVSSRASKLVPAGTRAVSVFLVNKRTPTPDVQRDAGFIFQVALRLHVEPVARPQSLGAMALPILARSNLVGFVARPNLRGRDGKDWDDQVADLQYRGVFEFAVGHGAATTAHVRDDRVCAEVETTWAPRAEVERVVPGAVPAKVELGMEALAELDSAAAARDSLGALVDAYATWIEQQRGTPIDHATRRDVAVELLRRAENVRRRIAAGIELLATNDRARLAFRLANRAMARAARQRDPRTYDKPGAVPTWRPFQLAFVLMNLPGIVDPKHADRETVDLLFFPTGGGKTEAYLGLAAVTLVLRRLENPGVLSAGMSVLMRYTLRLLTLDQLGRAATLICALELERAADVATLGTWPFEIGLWVGQAATPNRMGAKGDGDKSSARSKTIAFRNDEKKPSPIPLENCPWCGTKFKPASFTLVANGRLNEDHPTDLRVSCVNRRCEFSRDRLLPVVAVDEPIYRRLPCFLIATVDKFASLPWVGETGALFGKVERHDAEGFYGPCEPTRGRPLEHALLPPDLIIQDELHLISGPLGTMVGLYETALDALTSRTTSGKTVRPKVIASTATIRRAEKQIHALFARRDVDIFPPPGPDVRDSFFAKTVPAIELEDPKAGARHARLYLGIAAQGRSLKVVLLRTYLALMAAVARIYEEEGGSRNADNPADPYMTLLGYFNSLRELGGSRRIVEDEVSSRLVGFDRRRRVGQQAGPFAGRRIAYEVLELTSRESTAKVADTKRRLAMPYTEDDHVDVALATNMISVGLDITRLGLMVVLGQPKTTAEYIQATSRVGRDDARPGLVVTLLNVHRPRDRSHYERFEAYHESFYRSVEATSVTPFAPRAVDRGLAGVTVALVRHGVGALTAPASARELGVHRSAANEAAAALSTRFAAHDRDLAAKTIEGETAHLKGRIDDLLDSWSRIGTRQKEHGAGLQYQREVGEAPPLLRDPLDPELKTLGPDARKFRAHRSLRDVEPSVNLWVKTFDGALLEQEEES